MLTGLPLLLLIVIILILIIYSCAVLKWHPFPVLIISGILLGLIAGLSPKLTLDTLLSGSGSVFASIGLIIALGTILGEILEKTGAVASIATYILQKAGSKYAMISMSALGGLVGIPVFCDSGFIIISRLAGSISKQSKISYGALSIALATGLYTTHVLIPPTPGPLAAVGNFNMAEDIGWVIFLGIIVSIPSLLTGWYFAKRYAKKHSNLHVADEANVENESNKPGLLISLFPLILPVVLIALGSTASFMQFSPEQESIIQFICNPNIALLLAVISALLLLAYNRRKEWNGFIQQSLLQAGPIIFITAAGGALGAVLKATPIADEFKMLVTDNDVSTTWFFPMAFLLAAGLKTAQGSSTASLIITSSIIAPLLAGMNMEQAGAKALLVLCIGAGAMTVSHANDSYFWVISHYGKVPVKNMYRYFTSATFFMGLSILLSCMLIYSLFFNQ
ncbi:MAG: GntP family permease [Flavitalea sp.]